jgi:hypothetical protein
METNDELMHPVGDHPSWSESYYFNFVDPVSKVGMFTRMGFRPGNGWADALHVIYLQGRRVAFTYGRRDIDKDLSRYDGDLKTGALSLTCVAPHKQWHIHYLGPAQDIADGEILLTRSRARPEGWFEPAELEMTLQFDCLTEPHYANQGEHGHFEQSGRVSGQIRLGDERWPVTGYGVRDKSWGPRDWGVGSQGDDKQKDRNSQQMEGPQPFVNWFSMNFGEDAALGGSCFRQGDGSLRGSGWLQRGGESVELSEVTIRTGYKPDSIIHEAIELEARTAAGEKIAISGQVSSVCPTKIPMPGGAIFINEGLAQFRWDERVGYGIAEHWHGLHL